MADCDINFDKLDSITEGDNALKREILSLFDDSANRCLVRMKPDATEEDWKTALHELKGAADNLGFKTIGDACREAEEKHKISAFTSEDKAAFIQKIPTLIDTTRQQMNQKFGL